MKTKLMQIILGIAIPLILAVNIAAEEKMMPRLDPQQRIQIRGAVFDIFRDGRGARVVGNEAGWKFENIKTAGPDVLGNFRLLSYNQERDELINETTFRFAKDFDVTSKFDMADLEDLLKQIEDAKKDLDKALADKKKAEDDLAKAQADKKKAQDDLAKAKADLDKAQADLDKAKADRDKAKADLDKAKADKAKAQADLDKAKADKKKAEDDLATAKADKAKAQADLDRAKKDKEIAQADLDRLTKERNILIERRDKLIKERDGLIAEREKVLERKTTLEEIISRLEQDIKNAESGRQISITREETRTRTVERIRTETRTRTVTRYRTETRTRQVQKEGPTGRMLTREIPTGRTLTRQVPTGRTLTREVPTGRTLTRQVPTGKTLTRQVPTGRMLTRQVPTGRTLTREVNTGRMLTRQVQDYRMEQVQVGTRTERVQQGYRDERVQTGTKTESKLIGKYPDGVSRPPLSPTVVGDGKVREERVQIGTETKKVKVVKQVSVFEYTIYGFGGLSNTWGSEEQQQMASLAKQVSNQKPYPVFGIVKYEESAVYNAPPIEVRYTEPIPIEGGTVQFRVVPGSRRGSAVVIKDGKKFTIGNVVYTGGQTLRNVESYEDQQVPVMGIAVYVDKQVPVYTTNRVPNYVDKQVPVYEYQHVPYMRTETYPEVKTETYPEMRTETYPEMRTETYSEMRTETYPEMRTETYPEMRTETYPEMRTETYPEMKTETSTETYTEQVPYSHTETYTVQVPYSHTETYTVTVPYSYVEVDKERLETLIEELEKRKTELTEVIKELERFGRIDEINTQIKEIDKQIVDIETRIKETRDRITDADRRIADAEGRITDADRRITDAEGRITDADRRIADAQGRIDDADRRIADAQDRYDEADGRVNEAQGRVDDANGRIADANGRIRDADGRIDDANGRIKDAEDRIKRANETLADLNKKLEEAKAAGMTQEGDFVKGTVVGTKDGSVIANIKTSGVDGNGDCRITEYEEFREEEMSGTYSISHDTRAKLCEYDDFKNIVKGTNKQRIKWGVENGKAVEEEIEQWKTFTDEDGNEVTIHTLKRRKDKVPDHILNPEGYSIFEKVVKDKAGKVITSAEYKLVGNKYYINEKYLNTPDIWKGDDKKIINPPLKGIDKFHNYVITINNDGKLDVTQKAKYVKNGEVLWHSGGDVEGIGSYDRPVSVGVGNDYQGDAGQVGTQGDLDLNIMPGNMNPPKPDERTVNITKEEVQAARGETAGMTETKPEVSAREAALEKLKEGAKKPAVETKPETLKLDTPSTVTAPQKPAEEKKELSAFEKALEALKSGVQKITGTEEKKVLDEKVTKDAGAPVSAPATASGKAPATTGEKLQAELEKKSAAGEKLQDEIQQSQTQQKTSTSAIDKAISGAKGFEQLKTEEAKKLEGAETEKTKAGEEAPQEEIKK